MEETKLHARAAPTIVCFANDQDEYINRRLLLPPAGVSATKRTYFSPFTKDSRALSPLAITPIIGTLWCTSCNERQLVYLVDSPIGSAGVACGMHSRGLRVVVLMPCWSHNPRICICAAAVHIAYSSSLVVPSRPFG